MDTIYIETSIVSYLRQRPSSQVVMAARQILTHQWWNDERVKYQLVASQFVIDEASAGDPLLAPRIHKFFNDLGIPIPIICTPEEMVNYDPEANY
jgi:hypothetical protein